MSIRNPYVYKITKKSTGEFYYGYKEKLRANGIDYEVIGEDYYTSSVYIDMTPQTVDEWLIEIVSQHESGMKAFIAEQLLIEAEWDNPLLLNQHMTRIKDMEKRYRPNYQDPAHREKLSVGQLARWNSAEGQTAKDHLREVALAQKSDPAYMEKWREGTKDAAEKSKKQHKDPQWKAKWREKHLEGVAKATVTRAKTHENKIHCDSCDVDVYEGVWEHHLNSEYHKLGGAKAAAHERRIRKWPTAGKKQYCESCDQWYQMARHERHINSMKHIMGGAKAWKRYKRQLKKDQAKKQNDK